jgi:hypothetical protein
MNNNGLIQFIPGVFIRPPNNGIGIQKANERVRSGGVVNSNYISNRFENTRNQQYAELSEEVRYKKIQINNKRAVYGSLTEKEGELMMLNKRREIELDNELRSSINLKVKKLKKSPENYFNEAEKTLLRAMEIRTAQKQIATDERQEEVRVGNIVNGINAMANQPQDNTIIETAAPDVFYDALPPPPPPPPEDVFYDAVAPNIDALRLDALRRRVALLRRHVADQIAAPPDVFYDASPHPPPPPPEDMFYDAVAPPDMFYDALPPPPPPPPEDVFYDAVARRRIAPLRRHVADQIAAPPDMFYDAPPPPVPILHGQVMARRGGLPQVTDLQNHQLRHHVGMRVDPNQALREEIINRPNVLRKTGRNILDGLERPRVEVPVNQGFEGNDDRANFFNQIIQGVKLKPANSRALADRDEFEDTEEYPRSKLLDEIKKGKILQPTYKRDLAAEAFNHINGPGLDNIAGPSITDFVNNNRE